MRPGFGEHHPYFQPCERARSYIDSEGAHLLKLKPVSLQKPVGHVQQIARQVQPMLNTDTAQQCLAPRQRHAPERTWKLRGEVAHLARASFFRA